MLLGNTQDRKLNGLKEKGTLNKILAWKLFFNQFLYDKSGFRKIYLLDIWQNSLLSVLESIRDENGYYCCLRDWKDSWWVVWDPNTSPSTTRWLGSLCESSGRIYQPVVSLDASIPRSWVSMRIRPQNTRLLPYFLRVVLLRCVSSFTFF